MALTLFLTILHNRTLLAMKMSKLHPFFQMRLWRLHFSLWALSFLFANAFTCNALDLNKPSFSFKNMTCPVYENDSPRSVGVIKIGTVKQDYETRGFLK